jgi:glucosamine-6-phosphate deaminase
VIKNKTLKEFMEVLVFENKESGSLYAAQVIANKVLMNNSVNEETVLGLATGSTPTDMYKALIEINKSGVSFSRIITYNLDEYYPMKKSSPHSYHYYMYDHFFQHVDIHEENIFIPNGEIKNEDLSKFCKEYELSIRRNGGIDIQVLGLGLNGHIGFNEPGFSMDSLTQKVTLSDTTRTAAVKYFGKKEEVPFQAISMGISTILNADHIMLMAWGNEKAEIVKESIEGQLSKDVPGTYLQTHKNVTIILDAESASKLDNDRISLIESKLS